MGFLKTGQSFFGKVWKIWAIPKFHLMWHIWKIITSKEKRSIIGSELVVIFLIYNHPPECPRSPSSCNQHISCQDSAPVHYKTQTIIVASCHFPSWKFAPSLLNNVLLIHWNVPLFFFLSIFFFICFNSVPKTRMGFWGSVLMNLYCFFIFPSHFFLSLFPSITLIPPDQRLLFAILLLHATLTSSFFREVRSLCVSWKALCPRPSTFWLFWTLGSPHH